MRVCWSALMGGQRKTFDLELSFVVCLAIEHQKLQRRAPCIGSLVPRPSRGRGRKAWYTLHAHALSVKMSVKASA